MAQQCNEFLLWGVLPGNGLGALNVIDPTGLAEHVRACSQSQARWLKLHFAAEVAQGFFATRVVTTGLLLAILMAMAIAAL